jgi:hypothetical protein
MKNTIYKIGILLLLFAIGISCESPEAETNYTPATSTYEYPGTIILASSNITNFTFNFTYTNSGGGKGYYVVVEGGSTAPTKANVVSGTAAKLIKKGNFALTGAPVTISIDGLCNNKTYDVYAVQMSADNFLSPSPVKMSVKTAALRALPGTYKANPVAFDEDADEFTATLTAVAGTTNQFTIDSAWGPHFIYWLTGNPGYDNKYLYAATITINTDNTVTIVGSNTWSAIGGTGVYNPCDNSFIYTLKQTLFGNPFTTKVVLTQIQ